MTEVELKNTSIYQTILHALYQNVPLPKESVETMIMPTIIGFIQGYYNLECALIKANKTGGNTIVVHSDNFVREKFIERACDFLQCAGAYGYGDDFYSYETDELIKDFKKYMKGE